LKPYGYTENKTKQSSEYGNEEESGNFIFVLVLIYSIIVGFLTCVPQFFPGHAAKLNYAVSVGSLMVSMSMVANIVAKISFGALSDKIGPKKSILITSAIALIGTLFLLLDINMYIGAFCYGFCFANSTVGLTALTREQFPLKDYVKKYPFISFVSTIVNAFGSPIAGFVYDQSGSYTPVFVTCLVMLVILFGVDFTIMAENRKKEGKR
ncbi:MAG: MFS transporter, partial [Erysipelotrichaceae bacterium]|nr:MFS transporter [Erysipelotrichaceae bacterium]